MKKIVYCPYCGHIYLVGWRAVKDLDRCAYCNSKTDFAETLNSEEYYLKKAEEQFGRGNHYLKYGELAFKEEISRNLLFNSESKTIEEERKKEVRNQNIKKTEYWREVRAQESKPRCPTCGSSNLKRITGIGRIASISFWGLASSKIGKQFECLNCGYKW